MVAVLAVDNSEHNTQPKLLNLDPFLPLLDQEGPVAASVDMHFPTPGEHKGLEDHEEQGQVVLDYKVQGCMVPLEFQALEAQEVHGGLGHHGAHGVQVALKDLLGPIFSSMS